MSKKLYGTFILKPDIFEKASLEELSQLLKEHNLPVQGTFLINGYHDFSLAYRKYDLNIRYANNPKEYERNLKRNMVAINAYQMEYSGEADKGAVMIVNNMYEDNDTFYKHLFQVKQQLREKIESRLGYVTYLYMGQDPWFTFKDKKERLSQLRTKENKTIDIAFINSIHLEDKDLFDRDACNRFIFNRGIISKENFIFIEELKNNYILKEKEFDEMEM